MKKSYLVLLVEMVLEKSTTIDCMIGSKKFSKGEVYISGFDIKKYPLPSKTNVWLCC